MLGALPLRNLSRLWGYLNSLELPIWARPTGFRLYAKAFGCNLEEVEHGDLTRYASLGDFFYRRLKDGVRPVADSVLVCIPLLPVYLRQLTSALFAFRSARQMVESSILAQSKVAASSKLKAAPIPLMLSLVWRHQRHYLAPRLYSPLVTWQK